MTFIARFSGGACGHCEERLREGQELQYDASDQLVHVTCPETLDVGPVEVCPDCFLALPVSGICGSC